MHKVPAASMLDLARTVLRTEAAAILRLVDTLDGDFERAIETLFECRGRVIVTGMGKSGIICRKIAATFSSTGTPAFFLHPAEAIHGDLGALCDDDVVIAMSRSGETEEVIRLLESIRRIGARLIAITGEPGSTLGKAADVTLDCGISEEACPLKLAPTASTTAALALGDALAMTLLVRKGFREEDFALQALLAEVAETHGVSPMQIALAWFATRPSGVIPIIGVTKMAQLEESLAAVAIRLTDAERDLLDAAYATRPVFTFGQ